MPVGQLITTGRTLGTNTSDAESNDSKRMLVMSNGRQVVIVTGGSILQYSSSADGITWTGLSTIVSEVTPVVYAIVQVGDQLNLFSPKSGNTQIEWLQTTWNTSTNLFGAVTQTFITPTNGATVTDVDACWDTTQSVFHVAYFGPSNNWYLAAINTSGVIVHTSPSKLLGSGGTAITTQAYGIRCVPGATSAVSFLAYENYGGNILHIAPATYNGTAYTVGTLENVYAGIPIYAACELDNNNNLDIVYIDATGQLQATKRTGTNIYQAPINIGSGVLNNVLSSLSLTADGAGGLYVLYSSVANQAFGEVYVAQRKSGSWVAPALLAGGDASGYVTPKSGPLTSGRVDIAYYTSQLSQGIYYKALTNGTAPNIPTPIGPTGNINSITPSFSWTYTNSSPNDIQGSYEIIVTRVSDSVVMWDSGVVASSLSSGIGYNGTALAYGVQYNWKVRVWDSVLLPTQASAYSATLPFTAYHSPTATITKITDFGLDLTSSPATLQSATLRLTATYTQPDGNVCNAYKITILQMDGATIVDSTSLLVLSPTVANGASIVTALWTSVNIQNNSSYLIKITVQDSVTNVTADSATWQINTNWAPPSPPTNFFATSLPDQGYIQLTWTNDPTAVTVNVFRRKSGTVSWTTLSYGALLNQLADFAPLATSYDYAIQTVNASGATSNLVLDSNNILGPKWGTYGYWLNSITNPTIDAVSMGIYDTPDLIAQWQHVEDPNRWVPQGRSKPITTYGKIDYWTATQNKFLILDTDSGSGVVMLGFDVLQELYKMNSTHMTLLYRDPYGHMRFVLLEKPLIKRHDVASWSAELDFQETDYPGTFVVV